MVLLGFMDGALAQLYYETFGLNLDFDAGFNGAYACMGGSAGYSNLDLSLGGVAATRYVAKIGWQTSRPNCLTASLYNQSTGAVVTAEAHYNVSDSNAKDAQLPHFGVKFYLNGEEDDLTVYVHDMYARVIRA